MSGDAGDLGLATNAELNNPQDVAVDAAGNIYISDWLNRKIRKIDTNGIISTFAGTGVNGFSGDGGQASVATLGSTRGISVDGSGNVYFCDNGNDRIRKIDTNGIITTIAGIGGFNAFSGDGSLATLAGLNSPEGIALDTNGNVYITDGDNHRIRKVDVTGVINTIVGTGSTGFSGGGFNGDGLIGTETMLDGPSGVAIDNEENLIFTDSDNHRIRKLDSDSGVASIDEFSKELISFYPNPISNNEELTIKSTERLSEIIITNSLGQTVYHTILDTNNYTASVSDLAKGVYLVKLSNNKNQSTTYKLVIN